MFFRKAPPSPTQPVNAAAKAPEASGIAEPLHRPMAMNPTAPAKAGIMAKVTNPGAAKGPKLTAKVSSLGAQRPQIVARVSEKGLHKPQPKIVARVVAPKPKSPANG